MRKKSSLLCQISRRIARKTLVDRQHILGFQKSLRQCFPWKANVEIRIQRKDPEHCNAMNDFFPLFLRWKNDMTSKVAYSTWREVINGASLGSVLATMYEISKWCQSNRICLLMMQNKEPTRPKLIQGITKIYQDYMIGVVSGI